MSSFKKYSKAALQSNLDMLFRMVRQYRNSSDYMNMLNFIARFRILSPYNAFLVQQQRPGARYVLTAKQWKRQFDRVPKDNARPLIMLVPFGPVGFLYEIADTQPASAFNMLSDEEILRDLEAPFQVKGELPYRTLNTLIANLPFHGIALDTNFTAGADYAAQISRSNKTFINIKVDSDNNNIKEEAKFLISINSHADNETRFASICHELAHLFCYHLESPFQKGWEKRSISVEAEEFEAESTAWLVCERQNIKNPSAKYLAGYLAKNGEIPHDVSVERILFATNTILDMLEPISVKDGLLYAYDPYFKFTADKILAKRKQRNNQQSLFAPDGTLELIALTRELKIKN